MIKKIAISVMAVIVSLLAFAAIQPNTFTVQREVNIKAPPEKIVTLITDFRNWSTWSPWEKLDPAMERTFVGPISGKGAVYAWNGNDKVGVGRMEITDARNASRVEIELDFIEPVTAHNTTEFTLGSDGDGTKVVWLMRGPSPFIAKLMGLFVSVDKTIGKDFEAGLANMKATAEK